MQLGPVCLHGKVTGSGCGLALAGVITAQSLRWSLTSWEVLGAGFRGVWWAWLHMFQEGNRHNSTALGPGRRWLLQWQALPPSQDALSRRPRWPSAHLQLH